jgi:hypothetical protein
MVPVGDSLASAALLERRVLKPALACAVLAIVLIAEPRRQFQEVRRLAGEGDSATGVRRTQG